MSVTRIMTSPYLCMDLLAYLGGLAQYANKEKERGEKEEESFLELSGLITVNPCNVRPAHLVWWRSNARHATKVCTLHNRVGFFDSSHQNFEFTSNFLMQEWLFLTDLSSPSGARAWYSRGPILRKWCALTGMDSYMARPIWVKLSGIAQGHSVHNLGQKKISPRWPGPGRWTAGASSRP